MPPIMTFRRSGGEEVHLVQTIFEEFYDSSCIVAAARRVFVWGSVRGAHCRHGLLVCNCFRPFEFQRNEKLTVF